MSIEIYVYNPLHQDTNQVLLKSLSGINILCDFQFKSINFNIYITILFGHPFIHTA